MIYRESWPVFYSNFRVMPSVLTTRYDFTQPLDFKQDTLPF